jgi:hypothetical protein
MISFEVLKRETYYSSTNYRPIVMQITSFESSQLPLSNGPLCIQLHPQLFNCGKLLTPTRTRIKPQCDTYSLVSVTTVHCFSYFRYHRYRQQVFRQHRQQRLKQGPNASEIKMSATFWIETVQHTIVVLTFKLG